MKMRLTYKRRRKIAGRVIASYSTSAKTVYEALTDGTTFTRPGDPKRHSPLAGEYLEEKVLTILDRDFPDHSTTAAQRRTLMEDAEIIFRGEVAIGIYTPHGLLISKDQALIEACRAKGLEI